MSCFTCQRICIFVHLVLQERAEWQRDGLVGELLLFLRSSHRVAWTLSQSSVLLRINGTAACLLKGSVCMSGESIILCAFPTFTKCEHRLTALLPTPTLWLDSEGRSGTLVSSSLCHFALYSHQHVPCTEAHLVHLYAASPSSLWALLYRPYSRLQETEFFLCEFWGVSTHRAEVGPFKRVLVCFYSVYCWSVLYMGFWLLAIPILKPKSWLLTNTLSHFPTPPPPLPALTLKNVKHNSKCILCSHMTRPVTFYGGWASALHRMVLGHRHVVVCECLSMQSYIACPRFLMTLSSGGVFMTTWAQKKGLGDAQYRALELMLTYTYLHFSGAIFCELPHWCKQLLPGFFWMPGLDWPTGMT